jgi:hypothetical protein
MFIEYGSTNGGRTFGPREARNIFKQMVFGELRNGRLSKYRRANLVKFAAALRLGAVEAGEVIQDAINEFESRPESSQPVLVVHRAQEQARGGWWPTVAIFAAVIILAVANLL